MYLKWCYINTPIIVIIIIIIIIIIKYTYSYTGFGYLRFPDSLLSSTLDEKKKTDLMTSD